MDQVKPEGSSSSRRTDNHGSASSGRDSRQQGGRNLGTPSRTHQQFDVPATVESGYAVFRSASPSLSPDNPEAREFARQKAVEELKSQLESLQVTACWMRMISWIVVTLIFAHRCDESF